MIPAVLLPWALLAANTGHPITAHVLLFLALVSAACHLRTRPAHHDAARRLREAA